MDEKIPMYEYGEFVRYKNTDGTTSCYRNLKFIGAFENDSAFCDLFGALTKEVIDQKHEIIRLKEENARLTERIEEMEYYIPKIGKDSQDARGEIKQLREDNKKLRLELSRARAILAILNQRGGND